MGHSPFILASLWRRTHLNRDSKDVEGFSRQDRGSGESVVDFARLGMRRHATEADIEGAPSSLCAVHKLCDCSRSSWTVAATLCLALFLVTKRFHVVPAELIQSRPIKGRVSTAMVIGSGKGT